MDNNIPRSHGAITDEEYRRLRQEEEGIFTDQPYQKKEFEEPLNPDDEEENPEDLLPELVEKDAEGPVYDLRSDFFVVLPDQIIRISQSSNLSWLALFYALPKELVEKRAKYLELPRNIRRLLNNEEARKQIEDDAFLELVLDCYAWAIWQELKVPDGKGGYKDIPGEW